MAHHRGTRRLSRLSVCAALVGPALFFAAPTLGALTPTISSYATARGSNLRPGEFSGYFGASSIAQDGSVEVTLSQTGWMIGQPDALPVRAINANSVSGIVIDGASYFLPTHARRMVTNGGSAAIYLGQNGTSPTGVATKVGSIWVGGFSPSNRLAADGEQAPGFASGVTYSGMYEGVQDVRHTLVSTPGGYSAFMSNVAGSGLPFSARGVFAGRPGEVQLVTAEGRDAAGLGIPGLTVSNYTTPRVFGDGQVAIAWTAAGSISEYVSIGTPGNMRVVARTDQTQANGLQLWRLISHPGYGRPPSVNNRGDIVLFGRALINGVNTQSVLVGGVDRELEVLARVGGAAPGMPVGAVFGGISQSFGGQPSIGGNGQVVFSATVSLAPQTSTRGVWAGSSADNLRLVATEGTLVPNDPFNAWVSFSPGVSITDQTLITNARDQIAFVARRITSTGGGAALFAYDPTGGLDAIVYPGKQLTLVDGSIVTVEDFAVPGYNESTGFPPDALSAGGQDGLRTYLNDAGQLAVTVRLTDGASKVLIFNIPTPAPASMLACAILVCVRRARRQVN